MKILLMLAVAAWGGAIIMAQRALASATGATGAVSQEEAEILRKVKESQQPGYIVPNGPFAGARGGAVLSVQDPTRPPGQSPHNWPDGPLGEYMGMNGIDWNGSTFELVIDGKSIARYDKAGKTWNLIGEKPKAVQTIELCGDDGANKKHQLCTKIYLMSDGTVRWKP